MTSVKALVPLVEQLIKGPLTHFYFYAGSGTRQEAFIQDDSFSTIQKIFQNHSSCEAVEHPYFIGTNRFNQTQLDFPNKTILLKELVEEGFTPKIWDPSTTLLIIPGGEASEIEEQIGDQIAHLLEFIRKGGLLWGICGAAYWLSRNRTFKYSAGQVTTVNNPRAFFPGCSYGPLPFPEAGNNHYEFKVTTPTIITVATSFVSPTFLAGGGYFEMPLESQIPIEVFAHYTDEWLQQRIAAVCCTHEKGLALLMHPHVMHNSEGIDIEIFVRSLPERGNWKEIKKILKDSQYTRMCFVAQAILILCERKAFLKPKL